MEYKQLTIEKYNEMLSNTVDIIKKKINPI